MSKYDQEGADKKPGAPQPHPDCMINVNFFNRQMARVRIPEGSSLKIEISDAVTDNIFNYESEKYEQVRRIKEYKNVTFSLKQNENNFACPLSFHMSCRNENGQLGFKEQLCNIFNNLGGKGYLVCVATAGGDKLPEPYTGGYWPHPPGGTCGKPDKFKELFDGIKNETQRGYQKRMESEAQNRQGWA
jgi:hypothetical protein